MANIRFISDNAADRSVLSASTTSGTLVASNMQRNEKSAIWRSTSTTATITATWTTAESIDSVVMGWTNLTPVAVITVNLYTESTDVSPVTTKSISPDSALPLGEFTWGVDPLVQGGALEARVASQAQVWFDVPYVVKKVEIIITDTFNVLGYIEASRLSIGLRREMQLNPLYGASVGFVDRSTVSRAESGDVRTESQGIYRTLTLDFEQVAPQDAAYLMRLSSYSRANSLFVSLFPDTTDMKQQTCAFFATVAGNQSLGYLFIDRWSNNITLEEIA